ncbi:hypothetical protein NGUA15_04865 [Salmonella enterica]|nr:hypothetical protein NGUA15_04865 [Salmonella enterica]
MTDGRDKRGLVAAGAFQRVLITLTFGNITTKSHQAMTFTDTVVIRHFTNFKAGLSSVRIIQPLFIGQGDVMAEYFFVGFNDFLRRFGRVHIFRLQMHQLFFALAG